MNDQYMRNRFSLLGGGRLLNIYQRAVHSFKGEEEKEKEKEKEKEEREREREEEEEEEEEIEEREETRRKYNYKMQKENRRNKNSNKYKNINKTSELGVGVGLGLGLGLSSGLSSRFGTTANEQIQQMKYTYEESIEPTEFSPSSFSSFSEEQKLNETKFNNQLIQSYYNSTCYNDKRNSNFLKDAKKLINNDYIHSMKNKGDYKNKNKNNNDNHHHHNHNHNDNHNNKFILRNDFDNTYKNKELLLTDESNIKAKFHNITDNLEVYSELKKLKNDVALLQMMNVNLQKQLISAHLNTPNLTPQHIIINNNNEVASSSVSKVEKQNDNKNKGFIYYFLKTLLNSRFNQMLFISSIFVSFFLINKHWQKALKIAQLEKKVNSNILLRSVKMLEETMGIRKLNYI